MSLMKDLYFGCVVVITYVASTSVALAAPPAVPEVQIAGTRVHVSDVVKNAPADVADIDLGAAPAGGGSRLFERGDITAALGDHKLEVALPQAVRVVRKMHKLDAAEIEKTVRATAARTKMPRGATLAHVRAPRPVDVPEGWTTTRLEIPKPPRRAGAFVTTAVLSFEEDGTTTARIQVPIELELSQEAATPEMTHGSEIQLVVRRGLVEVATPATAGGDGDAGDTIAVTVKESNRVLRAKIVDSTHALAMDGQ